MDFGAKLDPKIQQNPLKIDAKRPSDVEIISRSIFDRFFVPTLTSRIFKSMGFPKKEKNAFSKHCFSKCRSILDRSWCQLASIFPPKIHEKPPKNRSQEASFFRSIFASIFYRCLFDFGSQLGAMLATFSSKMGWLIRGVPPSLLDICSFSVFWAS